VKMKGSVFFLLNKNLGDWDKKSIPVIVPDNTKGLKGFFRLS
jgi:hypothetical protein